MRELRRALVAGAIGLGGTVAVAVAGAALARRHHRVSRLLSMVGIVSRGGVRSVTRAPGLFGAAGDRRQHLRHELAMETADDVMRTLGSMKGVLMKFGQMVSYADTGVSPTLRAALGRLQDSAPPMAPALAAQVVREDLGADPEQVFAEWDPLPIAAASIGQVHRAVTKDGRAVAVKVQYPDVAETMRADLANVALLRRVLGRVFAGLDPEALIGEMRVRLLEELDYRREAQSQKRFAACFAGHPTIRVPAVIEEYSSSRVLTTELIVGARFAEAAGWSQPERDAAAETIYRFVFESLYQFGMFNGDPHPGNYLFHGDGQVTFLDYGMVKYFTPAEVAPLFECVRTMVVEPDPQGFRRAAVAAGFLRDDPSVTTAQVVDGFRFFYDILLGDQPKKITEEYASQSTRHFFDASSPLNPYLDLPPAYVVLQRINVGMFAILGALGAQADWRSIVEEIWPLVHGAPSTPIGHAEAAWRQALRA